MMHEHEQIHLFKFLALLSATKMHDVIYGKKHLNNLNLPELLCLPSDPQEMGTETFLQDFSKEKTKKNLYNLILTKT